MNIDDLRDQLAELAGPEVRATVDARDAVRARVRRTRRRQRATGALSTVLAAALVIGIVGVGLNGKDDSVQVRTTTPTTVALDTQCRLDAPVVPAKNVPSKVAAWADNQPIVGGDELWTTRQSLASNAIQDGSIYRLKIGWYTTPFGMPLINARRVDGPGTAPGLVNEATDQHGKWVASTIDLPSAGCWEITAYFDRSRITFRRVVGNPPEPLAIGTITGTLVERGVLVARRALSGHITVTPVGDITPSWSGETTADGHFSASVPVGGYVVSGTSPSFLVNGGPAPATCHAEHSVVVGRGQTTTVEVVCEGP